MFRELQLGPFDLVPPRGPGLLLGRCPRGLLDRRLAEIGPERAELLEILKAPGVLELRDACLGHVASEMAFCCCSATCYFDSSFVAVVVGWLLACLVRLVGCLLAR